MKLISELLNLSETEDGGVIMGFNKPAYLLLTDCGDLTINPTDLGDGHIKQIAFPEGTIDKYEAQLLKAGADPSAIDDAKFYMVHGGADDWRARFQIFEINAALSEKELGRIEGKMETANDEVGYTSTVILGPLTVKKLADYINKIYG